MLRLTKKLWKADINHPLTRNILSKQPCEDLLQRIGVNNDTIYVLYGDFNNWFAAFAFWVFKYYGYKDIRLMNGGRKNGLKKTDPLQKICQHIQKEISNHLIRIRTYVSS
jgi:thiosulfate/3-mercaptopyruvate sulfurtransferase